MKNVGALDAKGISLLLNSFVNGLAPEDRRRAAIRRMGPELFAMMERRSSEIDNLAVRISEMTDIPEARAFLAEADVDSELVDGFIARAYLKMDEIEASNLTYLYKDASSIWQIVRFALVRGEGLRNVRPVG